MTYKTLQELFDTAANHLLEQMSTSEDERQTCRYRGPEGMKCAVGALIPDSAYIPEIENCDLTSLFSRFRDVLEESGINPDSLETEQLLSELQEVHDMYDPIYWSNALRQVAENFNLNFEPKG